MKIQYFCIPGLMNRNSKLTIAFIEELVLEAFLIFDEKDQYEVIKKLHSRTRIHPYPTIRHLVFYFAYRYIPTLSIHEIASWYDRDHATVMHSVKKIKNLYDVDSKTKRICESIMKNLTFKIGSHQIECQDMFKRRHEPLTRIEKDLKNVKNQTMAR